MKQPTSTNDLTSRYSRQRQQLIAPINHYLQQQNLHSTALLLDGTGPRLTVHLPYLTGLGKETLQSFQHIHAFSGGVGAYCAYLAQSEGALRYPLDYYFESADKHARNSHRQPLLRYPALLKKLIQKRPIYDRLYYMDFFQTIFTDEFLQTPLDSIAKNLIPYIAHPKYFGPIALTEENSFDRSKLSLYQVLAMTMKIPHLYAIKGTSLVDSAYDANYTVGYLAMRNKLAANLDSAVIVSLYPRGLPKHTCVIDLAKNKKIKPYLFFDVITLLLNIPNRRYKQDLYLAYK